MQIFNEVSALDGFLEPFRRAGKSIGFVPTMGALHAGHLALVKTSLEENDLTICSIFVNPIQFNNPDDLARYPRTLESDCQLLDASGCDVVFAPSVEEMYPSSPVLSMRFGRLESVMEGAFRQGHFNGVGIVVSKLFNLVRPHRAYFGRKDLQQSAIVKTMVRDLSMALEVIVCPTVRETDGLAMSSRNQRLNEEERALAPRIFHCLSAARDQLVSGVPVDAVKDFVTEYFALLPAFRLEYFEVADVETLEPVETVLPAGQNAICIAIHLGQVRLIDNLVF